MRTVIVAVAKVRAETPLAFLFEFPTDADDEDEHPLDREEGEKLWVPKSVIEDEGDGIENGDEDIEVNIAEWFCEKEGLV